MDEQQRIQLKAATPFLPLPDIADLQDRFGTGMWYDAATILTGDLKPGREKSLCLTKLEEAQSWALRSVTAESRRVQDGAK